MIRAGQLLLVLAAAGLWVASRLPWVTVRTFDGLGQPRTSPIDGAAWSTALLPLALLLAAAALAALAVRGWALRVVALLVAGVCLVLGYLGVSLLVMPDVGPRGATLAGVPVMYLVGSQRHPAGAALTLLAAVAALVAAVLLIRSAASSARGRYARVPVAQPGDGGGDTQRILWDALDEGRDPTETEGR